MGRGKATDVERRAADLRAVMQLPAGRRFMYDLIDRRCRATTLSYTGSSETFFREGQRKVGIDLMQDLFEECSTEYVMMMTEALTARRQANIIQAAETALEDGE